MSTTEETKEVQRQEHLSTVKIQKVTNGYVVRIPFKGVLVFTDLPKVFDCISNHFKEGSK